MISVLAATPTLRQVLRKHRHQELDQERASAVAGHPTNCVAALAGR
ncbi:MAG TPA: hypothetical protein PKD37_06645 [Oligoflexia bacterium]|nr:hypothetical protein [Oligoflexia bacterium]HMP27640.1 hypothetical protein [Oligoflexia bacterium]